MKTISTRLITGLFCVLTGVLAGCESLPDGKPNLGSINSPRVSGDPCRNADWFEVGRIDGLTGIPLHASTYVGRCVSLGIAVNHELYGAGWQRGLVDYCTPERAYDAGRAGETYNGICPGNLEAAFLKRFKIGQDIAALEKKNAVLETTLDQKVSELSKQAPGQATSGQVISGQTASSQIAPKSVLTDAVSRMPGSVQNDGAAASAGAVGPRQAALMVELQKIRDELARNENAIRELENSVSL